MLGGGALDSWVVGLPAIAAALAARQALGPEAGRPIRLGGALRFAAAFVKASLVSGIDVARRALRPEMGLKPGIRVFPLALATRRERVLLAAVISLLPGTLGVGLSDRELTVHVLDTEAPVAAELAAMEARIAGLFGPPGRAHG